MVPDMTIEDIEAHKAQAAARGFSVGYADLTEKWVLLCPQDNYRGSYESEELAWRAAPRDRRSIARPANDAEGAALRQA